MIALEARRLKLEFVLAEKQKNLEILDKELRKLEASKSSFDAFAIPSRKFPCFKSTSFIYAHFRGTCQSSLKRGSG